MRRLNAYYYSFEPTGCDATDAILEAVARAGKGYHHTENWGDADPGGTSYVDQIQQAANEAAALIRREALLEMAEWEDAEAQRHTEHVRGYREIGKAMLAEVGKAFRNAHRKSAAECRRRAGE